MGCGTSSKSILEPKGRKIIMLGAGGSGKTSILYQIAKRMQVPAIPTIGHNAEQLTLKKDKFVLYDIGGRNSDFSHLLECSVALVFVIDAANPNAQQFRESTELFLSSIKNPYLRGVPVAICLNKQDIQQENIYIDENVIETKFGLKQLAETQDFKYRIFKISYKTQLNIMEPFLWIQSLNLKPNVVKSPHNEGKKSLISSSQIPGSTEQPHSNISH